MSVLNQTCTRRQFAEILECDFDIWEDAITRRIFRGRGSMRWIDILQHPSFPVTKIIEFADAIEQWRIESFDDDGDQRFIDYSDLDGLHRGPSDFHDGYPVEIYLCNGQLHREDGPARTEFDSSGRATLKAWYIDGSLHREDGPAIIELNEHGEASLEEWYSHGKNHREDGPAYVNHLFKEEKWLCQGELHREDGPAHSIRIDEIENIFDRSDCAMSEHAVLSETFAKNGRTDLVREFDSNGEICFLLKGRTHKAMVRDMKREAKESAKKSAKRKSLAKKRTRRSVGVHRDTGRLDQADQLQDME